MLTKLTRYSVGMNRDDISEALLGAVSACGFAAPRGDVLEFPADPSHGDYASTIALALAKEAGMSPRKLADMLCAKAQFSPDVARVSVEGAGFINITLSRSRLRDVVRQVHDEGERWGSNSDNTGKKFLVEHTQPNPFKPFHIGHLMSNTIGESIARLYEFSGAEVRRANYQGDVGLHVAKTLWGLNKLHGNPHSIEDLGNAYVLGNREYEDNAHAKREIVAYNRMVYEHAPEIAEQYKIGREASLEHFDVLYRMLGTKFDYYFFESETQNPGRALVKEGLTKGIFEESDGAVVFRGEWHGLHTRVFMTREGLPTYEAKELGLAQQKAEKWPFDLSITTTAVEQADYFKVVLTSLGLLRPELAGKFMHIPHGMMVLTSGKMSSRKGNVVTGESLLNSMYHGALEKVASRNLTEDEKKSIATAVAIAAIKYSVLKQKAGKNITFDPEKSLSFEGDSGPYLQYAYTRAQSVLTKAKEEHVAPSTELAPQEAPLCERLLVRFPDIVSRAQMEHEPHHITTYLIDLAAAFNQWYSTEKILDGSVTAPYKLALAEAVAQTLRNGLWLLGIQTPIKM